MGNQRYLPELNDEAVLRIPVNVNAIFSQRITQETQPR